MSGKKETAVEWLFSQIPDHLRLTRSGFEMLQQSKELEKQQIIDAYWDGGQNNYMTKNRCEQYYSETYER
jgi:HEPN domain-containing protein